MEALQWAPSGNPFDGVPNEMCRFLAGPDGKTFGYGYGPGWSMMFGTSTGEDVTLLPGQWVIRHDDGRITVQTGTPDF